MTRVFVDSSAILALLNPDDPQHAPARDAFQRLSSASATLVTTSYVLAELYALIYTRMGQEAVQRFRQAFTPLLDVVWVDRELHEAGLDLMTARGDRPLSLVDAVSFVTIRSRKLDGAFACDALFREDGIETVP